MLKKLIIGLLLTSSLFSQNVLVDFFKYSTAYASFSLNAPRYQGDKFTLTGNLDQPYLDPTRIERELEPDIQKSFGLRKIGSIYSYSTKMCYS